MENGIKVGEYVRTEEGYIGKLVEYIPNALNYLKIDVGREIIHCDNSKDNFIYTRYGFQLEHSFNLIDLIQKDDFVNGDRVVAIDYTEDENGNYVDVLGIMEIDDDYAYPIELRVINIREVITKEIMESISYKVTKM